VLPEIFAHRDQKIAGLRWDVGGLWRRLPPAENVGVLGSELDLTFLPSLVRHQAFSVTFFMYYILLEAFRARSRFPTRLAASGALVEVSRIPV
jgi:hypothetical protein